MVRQASSRGEDSGSKRFGVPVTSVAWAEKMGECTCENFRELLLRKPRLRLPLGAPFPAALALSCVVSFGGLSTGASDLVGRKKILQT
jgi:hypothetical protein